MKLSEYYESEYPEHGRASCSDENPVNSEPNGHGCLRCNAIFFTKAEQAFSQVNKLEKKLDNAYEALCAIKTSGVGDDIAKMAQRGVDNKSQLRQ